MVIAEAGTPVHYRRSLEFDFQNNSRSPAGRDNQDFKTTSQAGWVLSTVGSFENQLDDLRMIDYLQQISPRNAKKLLSSTNPSTLISTLIEHRLYDVFFSLRELKVFVKENYSEKRPQNIKSRWLFKGGVRLIEIIFCP